MAILQCIVDEDTDIWEVLDQVVLAAISDVNLLTDHRTVGCRSQEFDVMVEPVVNRQDTTELWVEVFFSSYHRDSCAYTARGSRDLLISLHLLADIQAINDFAQLCIKALLAGYRRTDFQVIVVS